MIDDLHWLDASSADLRGARGRHPPAALLVAVGGARGPGSSTLDEPDVVRIDLGGFDERGTGELARAVAGAEVNAEDARRLHARTGETALHQRDRRAIVDERDHRRQAARDGRGAAADLPVTLRALLGSRIDALLPAGRTVLRVGSVIGMTFRSRWSGDRGARRPVRHGASQSRDDRPDGRGSGWGSATL